MTINQRISLNQITLASPCDVDWNDMHGNAQVRDCALCAQKVYNLITMSEVEIAELFARNEKLPCIRLYRRRDGTIITQDHCATYTPVQRHVLLKGLVPLAVSVLLAGCQHQPSVTHQPIALLPNENTIPYLMPPPTAGVPLPMHPGQTPSLPQRTDINQVMNNYFKKFNQAYKHARIKNPNTDTTVLLDLNIDPKGNVIDVKSAGSNANPRFTDHIVKSVKQIKFAAGDFKPWHGVYSLNVVESSHE